MNQNYFYEIQKKVYEKVNTKKFQSPYLEENIFFLKFGLYFLNIFKMIYVYYAKYRP